MGDILGILINKKDLKKNDLKIFHMCGESLGVQVCFLTASGLNLQEQKAMVYCFDSEMKFDIKMIPIPRVIYNQSRHVKLNVIRKIRKLRNQNNVILYNPTCTLKWRNMSQILHTDPGLLEYLLLEEKKRVSYPLFQGTPFCLNLTLQKDFEDKWTPTGIIGRLFNPNHFPMNKEMKSISIRNLQLSPDFNISDEKLELINEIGIQAASVMDKYIPNLADISLSLTIDDSGNPLFFDGGLRNRRSWYKEAGELSLWEDSLRKPIEYGCFLLKQI